MQQNFYCTCYNKIQPIYIEYLIALIHLFLTDQEKNQKMAQNRKLLLLLLLMIINGMFDILHPYIHYIQKDFQLNLSILIFQDFLGSVDFVQHEMSIHPKERY